MKLKLNFQERLIFISLLTREENFTTLRIIRKVKEDLGITDEEYDKYKVKPLEDGRINFDLKLASEEKEFEIGDVGMYLVKEALLKLDKDKKLKEEQFPLYEKILDSPLKD